MFTVRKLDAGQQAALQSIDQEMAYIQGEIDGLLDQVRDVQAKEREIRERIKPLRALLVPLNEKKVQICQGGTKI